MLSSWKQDWKLRRLINDWSRYRVIVNRALEMADVTEIEEHRFLRLKAKIASQLVSLEAVIPVASLNGSHRQLNDMSHLISDHVSPAQRGDGSAWTQEEFDRVWHSHYIFLNKLRGMKLRQESKPQLRKVMVPSGVARRPLRRHSYVRSGAKAMMWLVALGVVAFLLGSGIGVSGNGDGGFTVNTPETFQKGVANVVDSANTLYAGATDFLSPVLSAYGVFWTFMLVAALMSALGYFVFIR